MDDSTDEATETVVLTLEAPASDLAILGIARAKGIIEDNDLPIVTVVSAMMTENRVGVFTLMREGDLSVDLTINYRIKYSGTGTSAEGYLEFNDGSPTLEIRADRTARLTLLPLDDYTSEYVVGDPHRATVTVGDDVLPTVTVAPSATDSDMEGAPAVFTITRAGDLSEALDVFFTLEGGDDVPESQAPTSATIDAGETSGSVSLATVDDDVDEPDATLTLSEHASYELGTPSQASRTVEDNDMSSAAYANTASSPAMHAAVPRDIDVTSVAAPAEHRILVRATNAYGSS